MAAVPVLARFEPGQRILNLFNLEEELGGHGQITLALHRHRATLAGLVVELHIAGLHFRGDLVSFSLKRFGLRLQTVSLRGQQLTLLEEELAFTDFVDTVEFVVGVDRRRLDQLHRSTRRNRSRHGTADRPQLRRLTGRGVLGQG